MIKQIGKFELTEKDKYILNWMNKQKMSGCMYRFIRTDLGIESTFFKFRKPGLRIRFLSDFETPRANHNLQAYLDEVEEAMAVQMEKEAILKQIFNIYDRFNRILCPVCDMHFCILCDYMRDIYPPMKAIETFVNKNPKDELFYYFTEIWEGTIPGIREVVKLCEEYIKLRKVLGLSDEEFRLLQWEFHLGLCDTDIIIDYDLCWEKATSGCPNLK